MSDEVVVKAKNLTHVYSNGVVALKNVNLEIRKGEFIAIIGHNGSGKTTLAKHINGLLKPTAGEIFVHGMDTRKATVSEIARKVGYVFQNPDHQICMRTVWEELAFGPRNLGFSEEEVNKTVKETLALFNLEKYSDVHPFLLGKADRLRIALCSVLTMRPETLVVDEPTTGQDMRQSYEVMETLKKLNGEGKTIIFITHNMRLVAEYARRAVIMSDGGILLDGSVEEVFSNTEVIARAQLKPPQITLLASRFKQLFYDKTPLTVNDFCSKIEPLLGKPSQR
ncbi:MAG: ATP-binding cassette domain-containing protein [Candidatus Caldarchaeum sp.]|nr:ATP-binding cassette domain-containing protein [Candidatus Caldarchaeum sp.]MDW7978010.1 ATP-binding cassette domain-containing protein [Candidatus Caldarchaeum sp.]MDW8359128.1 ATP-binding cassette domain-containing protein [Candidatus Caldarchaeum sp.]